MSKKLKRRHSIFSKLVDGDDNVKDQKIQEEKENQFRTSTYMQFVERMHEKVLYDLQFKPETFESERNTKLKSLFNDLTCVLDQPVKDLISKELENPDDLPKRYYLLLSKYYLDYPEKAEEILAAGLPLWNNMHFQMIFPLLFHQWLFHHCNNDKEFSIKRFAIFVKGANKILWLDLENGSTRFYEIWNFIKNSVILNEAMWTGLLMRKYMELVDLILKFYFYYKQTRDLTIFVQDLEAILHKHKDDVELPINHTKINLVNMFVNEVVRTMRLIKNEDVLITYLSCCTYFQEEMNISGRKTRLRLYDLLCDLATPGYPSYPTPRVKLAARKAIDILWPYGKFWRRIIRFSFRFFRPLTWVVWFELRTKQILLLLFGIYHLILSILTRVFHKTSIGTTIINKTVKRENKTLDEDIKLQNEDKKKNFISNIFTYAKDKLYRNT